MACEIMLHGGKTRRKARTPRFARDLAGIIAHQYKRGMLTAEWHGVREPIWFSKASFRDCRLPVDKMRRIPDSRAAGSTCYEIQANEPQNCLANPSKTHGCSAFYFALRRVVQGGSVVRGR